jgi:hypothetical protein
MIVVPDGGTKLIKKTPRCLRVLLSLRLKNLCNLEQKSVNQIQAVMEATLLFPEEKLRVLQISVVKKPTME